jgi:hypothetical protein
MVLRLFTAYGADAVRYLEDAVTGIDWAEGLVLRYPDKLRHLGPLANFGPLGGRGRRGGGERGPAGSPA